MTSSRLVFQSDINGKSIFQVNLVEWLKTMVTNRNAEGVLDPRLPEKPSSRALKRALLVALRCVDPNAQKRPKMGHVIHMLEADEFPFRDVSLHLLWPLIDLNGCFFMSILTMVRPCLRIIFIIFSCFLHEHVNFQQPFTSIIWI